MCHFVGINSAVNLRGSDSDITSTPLGLCQAMFWKVYTGEIHSFSRVGALFKFSSFRPLTFFWSEKNGETKFPKQISVEYKAQWPLAATQQHENLEFFSHLDKICAMYTGKGKSSSVGEGQSLFVLELLQLYVLAFCSVLESHTSHFKSRLDRSSLGF